MGVGVKHIITVIHSIIQHITLDGWVNFKGWVPYYWRWLSPIIWIRIGIENLGEWILETRRLLRLLRSLIN